MFISIFSTCLSHACVPQLILFLIYILIIVLIITSKIRQWHYSKAQFILFILNVRTLACYYAICIHDYFHIRIRLMECEINEMKSKL